MIVPFVKSKYSDPAVVTCDEVGRYAISTLSGHEGGANSLAHLVSSVIGAQPVITTATEANRHYVVGIGCRKGVKSVEVENAILEILEDFSISVNDVRLLSSAWIKKNEKGLILAAENLNLYLRFIPKSYYLSPYYSFEKNDIPMKHFGIPGVAEPSAVIAAINPQTVLKRKIKGNITISIVKENLIN
jgi:cobalt-precorrin 5A hydrolase